LISIPYNGVMHEKKKRFVFLFLPVLFWWVALFPGRLGYDYALLARIIREDEQTSWWGASFFWLFKITTFDSQFLGLISFISLISLAHALSHFVKSVIPNETNADKTLIFIYCTPLFGVFGLTVSHDTFQTSGIILLTSILIQSHLGSMDKKSLSFNLLLCGVYLTTTQYGIVIFLVVSLFLIRKHFKLVILSMTTVLLVFGVSNLAITQESKMTIQKEFFIRDLILIDLKCIAQHDEAEITPTEWEFLETFAPREAWEEKVSCSNPDILAAPLKLRENGTPLTFSFVENSLKIIAKQPAIPVMSHIQRSRVALPPPFFQPPDNQVDLDVKKPIGLGTNTALQSGPGLLHPSIDDDVLGNRPGFLRPLEGIALLPAFIVNQASWFWSWGGLWLYPLVLLFFRLVADRKIVLLKLLAPTILLHLVIIVAGPSSLGRYVMSTILMGLVCFTIQVRTFLYRKQLQD